MKLCRDCKWIIEPGEYAKCTHRNATMGKETGFGSPGYCHIERIAGCGLSGRYWEPAESVVFTVPWYVRLWNWVHAQ